MAENSHELIKARQLIRKMIILDHPHELLSIYQDDTIKRAYDYFINGTATSYFKQNIAVLNYLLGKHNLEKNTDNQLRLTSFIWNYFNRDAKVNYESKVDEISEKYLSKHCEFVQFHPSYDYTDFVEGLRPIKKDDNELGFELRDGVFKSLCKLAINDSTKSNYVIIIDEINRAEISKVFGELFFAIDSGYRGKEGTVKTQYSNMQPDNSDFYVPDNIYVIGTMNDIDRSVEAFDFAMRRRFVWVEVNAIDRINMFEDTIPKWKDIAIAKMKKINGAIENIEGLNSSYHIGPAYFLKISNYDGDFESLWNYHLEPLLKEYLRGLPLAEEYLATIKDAYDNV